jgi:hypothetical protein
LLVLDTSDPSALPGKAPQELPFSEAEQVVATDSGDIAFVSSQRVFVALFSADLASYVAEPVVDTGVSEVAFLLEDEEGLVLAVQANGVTHCIDAHLREVLWSTKAGAMDECVYALKEGDRLLLASRIEVVRLSGEHWRTAERINVNSRLGLKDYEIVSLLANGPNGDVYVVLSNKSQDGFLIGLMTESLSTRVVARYGHSCGAVYCGFPLSDGVLVAQQSGFAKIPFDHEAPRHAATTFLGLSSGNGESIPHPQIGGVRRETEGVPGPGRDDSINHKRGSSSQKQKSFFRASGPGLPLSMPERRAPLPYFEKKRRIPVPEQSSLLTATPRPVTPSSPPPKGNGVSIELDTADLKSFRDQMNIFMFTKLLGEGRDLPPEFVELPTRFSLEELKQAVEWRYQRRLIISFATPSGGLIELRPSTIRIFQGFEDPEKQVYCRALYRGEMRGSSASSTSEHSPALSGISDSSQWMRKHTKTSMMSTSQRLCDESMRSLTTSRSAIEGEMYPTVPLRRLSHGRLHAVCSRLHSGDAVKRKSELERIRASVDAQQFGVKKPLRCSKEELEELVDNFYRSNLQFLRNKEDLSAKHQFLPGGTFPKLSSDEWGQWQEHRSRPIKKEFRLKDQCF